MKISDFQAEAGRLSIIGKLSYCQALEQIAKKNGYPDWAIFKKNLLLVSSDLISIYLTQQKGNGLALMLAPLQPTGNDIEIVTIVDPIDPTLVANRVKLLYPSLPITTSKATRGVIGLSVDNVRSDLIDISMYSDYLWMPNKNIALKPGHFKYGISNFRFLNDDKSFTVTRQIYAMMGMSFRQSLFSRGAFDGFLDLADVCLYYNQSSSTALRNIKELVGMSKNMHVTTLLVEQLPVFEFCNFYRRQLCWKFTKEFKELFYGYNTDNPLIEEIVRRG